MNDNDDITAEETDSTINSDGRTTPGGQTSSCSWTSRPYGSLNSGV